MTHDELHAIVRYIPREAWPVGVDYVDVGHEEHAFVLDGGGSLATIVGLFRDSMIRCVINLGKAELSRTSNGFKLEWHYVGADFDQPTLLECLAQALEEVGAM